jgi:hypothetical protein
MANLKQMNAQMKVYKISQAWNASQTEARKYAVFLRQHKVNGYACYCTYDDLETAQTITTWLRESGAHCVDLCVYLENSKRYMPISF